MRKRDTRAAVALAVALSGLLAGACARRVEVFDLVEGLPLADVRPDTVVVPLGMPEARWQLGSGWLHQVFDRRAGMSAIAASRATLRFRVSGSGAVVLRLNGRPLTGSDAVGRRLEVAVNGRVLGRKRVLRRAESYSFRAPEGALRSGDNELTADASAGRSERQRRSDRLEHSRGSPRGNPPARRSTAYRQRRRSDPSGRDTDRLSPPATGGGDTGHRRDRLRSGGARRPAGDSRAGTARSRSRWRASSRRTAT